jgi:hypothetical protein
MLARALLWASKLSTDFLCGRSRIFKHKPIGMIAIDFHCGGFHGRTVR